MIAILGKYGIISLIQDIEPEQEIVMYIVKQSQTEPVEVGKDYDYHFFCKLFDDMIVGELCFLRRTHFKGQNLFSCRGCSKDTILSSPHRRARKVACF